jgi:hypothetical protein
MSHLAVLILFRRLKAPRTLAREVVRLFGILMVCLMLVHPQTVQAQSIQSQSIQSQPARSPAIQPPAAPTPQAPISQPQPSQASPSQPAPDEAPASTRPGLIDQIGKFFQDSPLALPPLKTPQQTLDDINARAKDAADNLSRLSSRQVVAGRVKCPVAANGAPDCKSAANQLCTEKGFKEGQSVDSDSAQRCSANALLSGKKPGPDDCRVENFVTRALCQ